MQIFRGEVLISLIINYLDNNCSKFHCEFQALLKKYIKVRTRINNYVYHKFVKFVVVINIRFRTEWMEEEMKIMRKEKVYIIKINGELTSKLIINYGLKAKEN